MLPKELRDLPYKVHTNGELGLMLKGVKPLAIFGDNDGYWPTCVTRYLRMFDRHVAEGRLVKFEKTSPTQIPDADYHQVFYALPGEEWRFEAMLELLDRPDGWSDEKEREFGSLLGYTDWQNDYWAARVQEWRAMA